MPIPTIITTATVSMLFQSLSSHPHLHIIDLGFMLLAYMPSLLLRLASQPAPCRPASVRVTSIDASALVNRGHAQMDSVRVTAVAGRQLRGLAKSLGIDLQFECHALREDNIDSLAQVGLAAGCGESVRGCLTVQRATVSLLKCVLPLPTPPPPIPTLFSFPPPSKSHFSFTLESCTPNF